MTQPVKDRSPWPQAKFTSFEESRKYRINPWQEAGCEARLPEAKSAPRSSSELGSALYMLFVDDRIRFQEFDEQLLDLLSELWVLDADPRCGLYDGALEPELLFVAFDTPANIGSGLH